MLTIFSTIPLVLIGVLLIYLFFTNPIIGLVFIASSLPVTDLLPDIPYLTSIIPLIGAVTLVSYTVDSIRRKRKPLPGTRSILVLGLLFLIWIFLTHPQAAWLGRDRNWVITYLQLVILAFLASEMLDSPEKHRLFFWFFSVATLVSSMAAIQQGSIGDDIDTSLRTGGLSEGANSAGRYFVVGMIFFIYLSLLEKRITLKVIAALGVITTFVGVFFTVSRTGILLIFAAIGLVILLNPNRKTNPFLVISFILLTLTMILYSDSILAIVSSILPSILQRKDTIGLRFKLWVAAWRMWQDFPLAGVGIGQFRFNLARYTTGLPVQHLRLVAHSTYFQLLSETGIVGLVLWVSMQINAIKGYWNASRDTTQEEAYITRAWLVATIILLIGGITMTQSAEKLLWISVGVGQFYSLKFPTHTGRIIIQKNTKIGFGFRMRKYRKQHGSLTSAASETSSPKRETE